MSVITLEILGRIFFFVYIEYSRKFPLKLSPFAWNINFVGELFKKKLIMFAGHDELGWVVRPNVELVFSVSEHTSKIKTIEILDGIGSRDDGIDKEPFALALGDGYTFCDGLEMKDCWTEILEDMLEKDVLNMGVSGYGTYQQYLLAEKILEKMKFKLVLWQVTYVDHLKDNCFTSRYDCNVFSPNIAFYRKNLLARALGESIIVGSIKSLADAHSTQKRYRKIVPPNVKYIEKLKERCSGCLIIIVETYRVSEHLRRNLCRSFKCIEDPPSDEKYFFKDKHLNPHGNAYLAEQILKIIKESRLDS